MTHALSFVSMGVEARCCPSKNTAHCHHMKRQPFLRNGHPHCGRCHCHCRHHLHCHHWLHSRCHCHCHCNHPLPLPLPSAIANAVAVDHRRRHLCCVAISNCCCHCPCRRPLLSLSPSAIAVAIANGHHHCHAIGHFRELLPWRGKNCIQPVEATNAYLNIFCLYSGWCIDQSQMTDQVLNGNGQYQRWAESSKQWAASEGSGWQQGGSRGVWEYPLWISLWWWLSICHLEGNLRFSIPQKVFGDLFQRSHFFFSFVNPNHLKTWLPNHWCPFPYIRKAEYLATSTQHSHSLSDPCLC
jgi:hypothetical protein